MAMVLRVQWERFVEEARSRVPGGAVYAASGKFTVADPSTGLIIASEGPLDGADRLREAEFKVVEGCWSAEGWMAQPLEPNAASEPEPTWIAAVAYRSADAKPGIWIDAYPAEPTPAEVLKRLYDEFRETGDLGDVSFEDFLRLAAPNVAVLTPHQVERYREQNIST